MNLRMRRRPLRRAGLVAILTLVLVALAAPPALAHTRLVSSTPGKGATAGPVTEVSLVFSDEISSAAVVVRDAAGKPFQSGKAATAGTKVTQKLSGALPAGSYTVAYRVVGEDGHPITGDDLTFTASAAAEEQPAKLEQEQTTTEETKPASDSDSESESGSGAVLWALIVGGLVVGVGIGLVIVYRAKRQYGAVTGSDRDAS